MEWKEIKGYEGLYEVSDIGEVRSLPRQGTKGRILKQHERKGYLRVGLTKDHKTTWCSVNRLVAEAFIPNPDNLEQVDHINSNRLDNRAENLQWLTRQDNVIKACGKKIRCIETGKVYNTTAEALVELGKPKNHSSITAALKGRQKSAFGYHWEYVGEE